MSCVVRPLRGLLLAVALLLSPWALAQPSLENSLWQVEIDPATLAIRVTPTGQPAVQASAGVDRHRVSALQQTPQRLSWQWDDGAWSLSATLQQRDLVFSIQAREPGSLAFLRQPASAMGKGLVWPLAEGHYVPAGDLRWQRFLLDQGEVNTTQDLSLPLWTLDHGAFTLSWLLTRPYNNRLNLSAEGPAMALTGQHHFTRLETDAPLTFTLYLGDADLLAGAKRYRQWLIDNGRYQTLEAKLARTPQGSELLGASHVYLWGNDLLGADDVRSWPHLLQDLRGNEPLAVKLRAGLDKESAKILEAPAATLDAYRRTTLLRSLNSALNQQARLGWQGAEEPDMQALARGYGELRTQMAKVFAMALTADPARWGSSLSLATMERLQAAGLSRLWLGLGEGWEGGLWHPEAVRAGVAAGYLVAPYDSYETALRSDENPDWSTAHLGARANRECAIVLEDGQFKSGFQQSGHYTDPRCVRPLLEARVKAVQARVGFNSWFLDAYATGMLFDSYRAERPMTQAQNAEGNIDASRWLAEQQQLVSGSEDGNGVTAGGVLFAHGMQTPVMGWGDAQMSKEPKSPYYLGNWYPPEQPAVFFKSAPLKEPYRTVYFAPATRLPLYQAVFHGALVTSHHWLFDSLKLSNVRVENELAQLLYNVPPLYHLSAATLRQRLPPMVRQDGFFRPLHQRLGTQALTDFRWLTADRQVQQTTFADGSRLLANFDSRAREVEGEMLPGQSIKAVLADGEVREYQVARQP
ncbi:glycoside hydrolase [Pseudomonas chlororaphis]|uniref:Glycosyl hydrolases related to GH101 family, GHL1-GHL3 n=1 Tax=Pseudomonas chlororaphis TaxID=587753 RepID=A0A1Q8EXE1_9PSED|nr:glycoside hydrolase [Pseudomonas chlororaphis]OLF56459.1 hypothetical protein BTN82_00720 [Pseudomonas chlororaphis]